MFVAKSLKKFEFDQFLWNFLLDKTRNNIALWEKIVLVIKKNFWNSRLKAKNLQQFWDHLKKFKQWTVRTILKQNDFLTCSWKFLISKKFEHLKCKLEQIKQEQVENILQKHLMKQKPST